MIDFDAEFSSLTGEDKPFPWQRALFEQLVRGEIPSTCILPTGLGKTSVIALWLLARKALSMGAHSNPGASQVRLPRRLVYVVNRRTVVDQTTTEVLKLAERSALFFEGSGGRLAVSTLRGQLADNRAWSADPSRPSVICGTVDMIGSRLLFSGYGLSFRTRPLHAGFLGQDALIVHDEAHLEPAFQELLEAIEREQTAGSAAGQYRDPWPIRVMALTATPRGASRPFTLTSADEKEGAVTSRLRATKRLSLHDRNEKEVDATIVDKALGFADRGRAVLIFVRTIDSVESVSTKLRKAGARVQELTGNMRGYERDQLVLTDEIFKRFLRPSKDAVAPQGTVYLACTSAGEVGVNISADDMVCDLSTFDSMAQRFGRVNRFGVRKDSEIHIVHPPAESFDAAKPMDKARGITLSLLQDLDGDACPEALGRLDMASRESGFAPKPKVLPTSGVLFDAWAMTTIRGHLPGRPPVSTYLHGVEEWEPSRSFVAWRDEVDEIHNRDRRRLLDKYPAQELLEDYPLKPHELLSDTTSRVLDRLRGLIELIEKSAKQEGRIVPEIPAWFVDEEGEVQTWSSLKDWLPDDRKTAEQFLAGRTILLSPAHCHPVGGRLSPEGIGAGLERADVADLWLDQNGTPSLRLRKFTTERGERAPPGMRRVRSIVLADDDVSGANEDADAEPSWRIWNWYELPQLADSEGSESGKASVKLDVHLADVAEAAQTIVNGLDLDERMRAIVVTAAGLHDLGKRRRLWQRGVGNHDPSLVLAKSGKRSSGSSSYRHELGSTLDAERERLIEGFSQDERDLLLHLVAAHHGRARPHFPSKELFDPEVPEVEMSELGQQVVTRFAALQKRFGRWGLAYLESLVRAADYAASANPSSEI